MFKKKVKITLKCTLINKKNNTRNEKVFKWLIILSETINRNEKQKKNADE